MIAKNKIIKVLTVAILVMPFAAVSAYGDPIIKEQFDYDPGLITGRNGGIGFGGAWSFSKSHGQDYKTGITVYSNGTGTTLNEDTGLSFSTLPVAGSALSRYGSAGRSEANRTISVASQTALTADNTTIWFSVLISPPSAHRYASFLFGTESLGHSDLGDLKAVGEGFGFTLTAVGGGDGGGAINALAFDGSIDPIIAAGTFTAVIQPGGTHYDPVMIVGKINWKPNGTPDELYLFSVSDLTIEPAEVDAFASIINLDLDQSGFDILSVCDTNSAIFDEIRFGGTFVSVGGIDPDAPTVDACPDKIAWSNVAVPLDGTVVNNDSQVQER